MLRCHGSIIFNSMDGSYVITSLTAYDIVLTIGIEIYQFLLLYSLESFEKVVKKEANPAIRLRHRHPEHV